MRERVQQQTSECVAVIAHCLQPWRCSGSLQTAGKVLYSILLHFYYA